MREAAAGMDLLVLSCVFLSGLLVGLLLVGALALYLLTGNSTDVSNGECAVKSSEKKGPPRRELPMDVTAQQVLEDTLTALRETATPAREAKGGIGAAAGAGGSSPTAAEGQGAPRDLVAAFTTLSADASERQKQNKVLCTLLSDFSKLHGVFAKEMLRLSQVAEGYVRADNQKPIDKWWNSFSIALDHLAQDHEVVSSCLSPGFTSDLSKIEQEHVIKKVSVQGAKCVSRLKEAMAACEARSKELQRLRERAAGGSGTAMSVGEHSKLVMKKDVCETALKAARLHLATVRAELDRDLPSIVNDFELIASSATDATVSILVNVTDALVSAQGKTTHILNRLKLDIASIASKVVDRNSSDPFVLEILEGIERGNDPPRVDMGTEAIAAAAACLLPGKVSLPPQFSRCLGEETCVWLNAFAGRMYRDAARSDYFHDWFCTKVGVMLNKGKRPDFVDVYHVSDVVFGAAPPSIRNIRWLPHCPLLSGQKNDPEHNVACAADICFRSGLSFTVTTKLWINWPRDRYAFIPVKMRLEVSEVIGRVHFGVQKRASFLSFLEEPYTRFAVKSEVGGDYKLTDIPRVSNLIIQKIKKYIRNKVCFPKAYKTRILWPKKWWPEGEDEYKESSSSTVKPEEAGDGAPERVTTLAEGTEGVLTGEVVHCDLSATGDTVQPPGTQAGLLTTTGAAVRDNLSKWIIKPLLHGKGGLTPKRKRKKKNNSVNGNDTYEDSSDDDAAALEPYRVDLAETEASWNGHVKKAFFHTSKDKFSEGTSTESKFVLSPSLTKEIQISRVRCGFAHAMSFTSLRQSSRSYSHTVDSADNIPCSVKRAMQMLPSSVTSREVTEKLRSRSYSVADFRSGSLAVCAYYYFSRNNRSPFNCDPRPDERLSMSRPRAHLSRISTTLSMRLANVGAAIQHRRQHKSGDHSHSRPSSSKRYQNDGFILHTTPRKEQACASNFEGDAAEESAKGKITNFFRLGRQIEKAKDALRSGLRRPDARRGYGALDTIGSPSSDVLDTLYGPSDLTSTTRTSLINDSGDIKISLPNGIGPSNASPVSAASVGSRRSPVVAVDPEKEAESLAWQARAQAISEASSAGEYPSMQGFLLMKQNLPSCKKWVVLRQGNLGVFNSPADNTKFGVPLTHVNLLGAICRPSSKTSCCLEIGVPMETPTGLDSGATVPSPTTSVAYYWMPFWADSEVQCRAWVMAVQQSSHQLQDDRKRQADKVDEYEE